MTRDHDADRSARIASSRRGLLRTLGAGAALGAGSTASAPGGIAAAQDVELPPPADLRATLRLDTSVRIAWEPVEETVDGEPVDVAYEVARNGESFRWTDRPLAEVPSLEPNAVHEVAVRAYTDDYESEWATIAVKTAPSYDDYPASVDLRVDPDRTTDDGTVGTVIEVSDLPEDGVLEAYRFTVSDAGTFGAFADEVRPFHDEDAADQPPLALVQGGWLGDRSEGTFTGAATGEPPTAADEPLELATVFHSDVDADTESVPFDLEVHSLVGLREGTPDGPAPWSPDVDGVEDWRFRMTVPSAEQVVAGPTVDVRDDRIVVSGATEFDRAGCNALYPRRVRYGDSLDRLGVVVDAYATHESDPTTSSTTSCGPGPAQVGYELEIVPRETPESVVVEEAFSDADRAVEWLDAPPELELPAEIADYELALGEDAATGARDGDVAPDVAVGTDPTVDFYEGDCYVSGALAYDADCEEPAVLDLRRVGGERGNVEVEFGARTAATTMPGDDCSGDLEGTRYELTLDVVDGHTLDRLRFDEREPGSHDGALAEPQGGEAGLPEPFVQYELWTDPGADAAALEEPPEISMYRAEGAVGFVEVEGALELPSTTCHDVAPTDASYDADRDLLEVHVDAVRHPDAPTDGSCPDEGAAVSYRLFVMHESLPSFARALEGTDADGEPLRVATEPDHSGCEEARTLGDGTVVCDLNDDGLYRDVTADDELGQDDVVGFFENQHREAWQDPELFDFSESGDVGHGDVVALFEDVATR